MSVKLRKRKNSDGTVSLRLDIYYNGSRKIETLKHLQLDKPSNLLDRENNKEKLKQAEAIALKRATELEANNYDLQTNTGKDTIVAIWMQSYIDSYTKKDVRSLQSALNRFTKFLDTKKKAGITFGNIDPLLLEDFIDNLESNSNGETARSYFNRFKKMIRYAYRKGLLKTNILDFVEKKPKGKAKKKDVLSIEEIKILSTTPTNSAEVRRAALFTSVTGIRWVDLNKLTWSNIDFSDNKIRISQNKTEEEVTIPLNAAALKLLGDAGNADDLIFSLPSANGANKAIDAWVKRAKINKKIRFHNFRHSYGTNLILNNVDLLTTSKLMGHTTVKHTQRYVDTAEELKRNATDKINFDL